MNISKSNFVYVPLMDYSKEWTDNELYDYFELNKEEIEIIEKTMRLLNEEEYIDD